MQNFIDTVYFLFIFETLCRTCEEKYEWVDGTAWLPSDDELKKLYRLMALMQPELEIDPSEDDVIG